MDGIRGYLIKADKNCTRMDSLAALEAATDADTKLLWLDIQCELSLEAETELSRV